MCSSKSISRTQATDSEKHSNKQLAGLDCMKMLSTLSATQMLGLDRQAQAEADRQCPQLRLHDAQARQVHVATAAEAII